MILLDCCAPVQLYIIQKIHERELSEIYGHGKLNTTTNHGPETPTSVGGLDKQQRANTAQQRQLSLTVCASIRSVGIFQRNRLLIVADPDI